MCYEKRDDYFPVFFIDGYGERNGGRVANVESIHSDIVLIECNRDKSSSTYANCDKNIDQTFIHSTYVIVIACVAYYSSNTTTIGISMRYGVNACIFLCMLSLILPYFACTRSVSAIPPFFFCFSSKQILSGNYTHTHIHS